MKVISLQPNHLADFVSTHSTNHLMPHGFSLAHCEARKYLRTKRVARHLTVNTIAIVAIAVAGYATLQTMLI